MKLFFKLVHSPDSDPPQVMASACISTSAQCFVGPGSAITCVSFLPQQLCKVRTIVRPLQKEKLETRASVACVRPHGQGGVKLSSGRRLQEPSAPVAFSALPAHPWKGLQGVSGTQVAL